MVLSPRNVWLLPIAVRFVQAAACCLVGSAAGNLYLWLMQRQVDSVTPDDEVPIWDVEDNITGPLRPLAMGAVSYRLAWQLLVSKATLYPGAGKYCVHRMWVAVDSQRPRKVGPISEHDAREPCSFYPPAQHDAGPRKQLGCFGPKRFSATQLHKARLSAITCKHNSCCRRAD